jgi:outer membrane protein
MKTDHYRPKHLKKTFIRALCLLLGTVFAGHAGDVPEHIRKAIEQEFPNATITEIRKDVWKGQTVTEVELTPQDGGNYEVILSDSGKILSIEEEKGLPWIGGELRVGLGVAAGSGVYKGEGSEVNPAPFFNYENGPLEILGHDSIDLTFKFYRGGVFSIGLIGSLSLDEGYDADDSDFLKGMDELETLYSAGLEFEGNYAGWAANLEILQDISGEHDGQEVELSLGYQWMVAGFEVRPGLSLTWMSQDTVDYLYGVSAKEARADRPAYSPDADFEIGAELMIQRALFGNFSAVGLVEVSTFGSEIADSPLVEEDYEVGGVLGVMYRF